MYFKNYVSSIYEEVIMQRYFVTHDNYLSQQIIGSDVFHIKNVMRSKPGDQIIVCDGEIASLCEITKIEQEVVLFEIKSTLDGNSELPFFVSLYQGYPKGDKLDDIIRHSVELGIYDIYPTIMKRSIFKLDEKKRESKLLRFNKIAKEAAEQSHRISLPKVIDIVNLAKIDFTDYDIKIVAYEESAKQNENNEFKKNIKQITNGAKVAIVIGPEGGIDKSEIDLLVQEGFVLCGLGPRILRTETAIMYILSAMSYEWELK